MTRVLVFGATVLLFAACNSRPAEPEQRQRYVIPDSLARTLVVDTVRRGPKENALTLTGSVDFNQENMVNIYPMVSGNIQGLSVALGDYVTAGQTLAVVRSSEMAGISNDLVTAGTNVTIAARNLDKTKDLYSSGLASVTDSLAAEVSLQQARSELNRVRRVLKINGGNTMGDYVIKAPISGFIVQKNINNNTAIRTDNANSLLTISDLNNVWIQANVYESNIDKVHLGDEVTVTTISYPDKVFKGRVDKLLNVLDPTNKVMKVRIVLPNPGYLLKPQMFASVTVSNTGKGESLYLPSGALIFDHSQNYVLLYKNNSDVKITPVEVGGSVNGKSFLLSGVNEGDRVIGSQSILIYDQLNN